ncbi:hypothetical protein Daura_50685 [Dactylosporangium aurantiacum]|uniref:Uncharacterized protein n=1 Tax=Dactylosporangium aurantiacum TaxID=35754 RepID=A0A9Q9MMB5_9ACTN|nr:hypothetical protein [Dactylosporangium aurantiacum]MDG6110032.1 hypothetical protein [Dactylosporangium aurantiacum]UWZ54597.1 hypothetical protein Daura_50685 [Dactylosporangium aurantiacum]
MTEPVVTGASTTDTSQTALTAWPADAPPPAGTTPDAAERGAGPVAVAVLAVGFCLAAAAQYLPWSSVNLREAAVADPDVSASTVPESIDVDLASLNSGPFVVYLGTLTLALVGIGILLTTRGAVRRGAAAGALAMLAGNALVLVGFKQIIDRLGYSPLASYRLPQDAVHVGTGYPLAAAATALLAVGVVIAVRGLGRPGRRARRDDPHDGSEPLELTVTPLH